MSGVTVVYHIWTGGQWRKPLREFSDALVAAEFTGLVRVGIVGPVGWEELRTEFPRLCRFPIVVADHGNEHLTLNAVRTMLISEHVQGPPDRVGGHVLYAHTKGSHDNTPFRDRWRRSMTNRLVGQWRSVAALLDTGQIDAVGSHWLTEAQFGSAIFSQTRPAPGSGFFGGNFWMARADYLRSLPPCPAEPRWAAESWIGTRRPRVYDLLPGWPNDRLWPELLAA